MHYVFTLDYQYDMLGNKMEKQYTADDWDAHKLLADQLYMFLPPFCSFTISDDAGNVLDVVTGD